MSKDYKQYLDAFFMAGTQQIMEFFSERDGAITGDMWVFIPGENEPDHRVLVVAHADTVFTGPPKYVEWVGTTATSGTGLGADDRAGCAMAAKLLGSGHSVLILDGEESGGIGASKAVRDIRDLLKEHVFALELDRMGDREVVTYSGTSSKDFDTYLAELFPGWEIGHGSYTDIATICPAIGICGANVAVGYLYQHSKHEFLDLTAWCTSLLQMQRVLALDEYHAYKPDKKVVHKMGNYNIWNGTVHPDERAWFDHWISSSPVKSDDVDQIDGSSQPRDAWTWDNKVVYCDWCGDFIEPDDAVTYHADDTICDHCMYELSEAEVDLLNGDTPPADDESQEPSRSW